MRFECYLCVTEISRLFYRFTVLAFGWKWEEHVYFHATGIVAINPISKKIIQTDRTLIPNI